jgi:lysophospholipase L1-like esterase
VYAVRVIRTNPDQTTASFDATVTIKDILIVSLGDSFASGQGNPDIQKDGSTPATWIDAPCARSSKAGPAQAAIEIEDADPHTSVTFLSLACTGAEIDKGILKKQGALDPQIARLKDTLDGRAIDALIISAGGNDLGFAKLVASCIRHKNCTADNDTVQRFSNGLNLLEPRYLELSERISELPAVKNVFITEYPDLVHDEDGDPCDGKPKSDPLRLISGEESEWASDVVIAGLNQKVREAAALHNWIYVPGISEKFRKHGFCTGKEERWVRTYRDARKIQGADGDCNVEAWTSRETIEACLISSGTFHPNEKGHKAYAVALLEALRKAGLVAAPGT